MKSLLNSRLWLPLLALALVLLAGSAAVACPTCKDTLEANDPARANLVQGYFYSILFMLSMPFLIFTGLCSYFYYEVCKARRQQQAAGAALVPAGASR